MLPELLEQDHRKQTGAGPAPGDHMERRRSLADLLAVPAGELLADMLNHLPLARRHLLMLDIWATGQLEKRFRWRNAAARKTLSSEKRRLARRRAYEQDAGH